MKKLNLEELNQHLDYWDYLEAGVRDRARRIFSYLDKLGNVRMPDFIEPNPWSVEWYWYSRPELELVTILRVHTEGEWTFKYSDEEDGWCEVSGTTSYENIPQKALELISLK